MQGRISRSRRERYQAVVDALLYDPGKDLFKYTGILPFSAAKLGKSGVLRRRIVKTEAEEPAVRDIETDLFAQLPLGIDPLHEAEQKHLDHQNRIERMRIWTESLRTSERYISITG